MEKNIVKINENTLRQIVSECVKSVLKEEEEVFCPRHIQYTGNFPKLITEEIERLKELEQILPNFCKADIRDMIVKFKEMLEY